MIADIEPLEEILMTKLFQDMRVRTAIIDERPEGKNYPNEKVGLTDFI